MQTGKAVRFFTVLWMIMVVAAFFFFIRALPVFSSPGGTFDGFGIKTAVTNQIIKTFVPGIYYGAAGDAGPTDSFSLPALCVSQWQPLSGYVAEKEQIIPNSESAVTSSMLASGNTSDSFPTEAPSSGSGQQTPQPEPPTTTNNAPEGATEASAANALPAHQPVGVSYSAGQLADFPFLLNTFFTLDPTTTIDETILNGSVLLAKDLKLTQDNSLPQILIYHTHSQEEFADSVPGDPLTGIVGVGNYLTQLLTETYGYNVIHDTTTYDLIDGELDRNKAYSLALDKISRILEENPSVQVVIDLHRDGIDGNKMTTMVNGRETAKFMFFNGLSRTAKNGEISYLYNPYIQDNLAFSLQLQLKAALYYPGVTRPIYLKGYRYNLHLRPRSILVEAGSQKNTFQEELNAMDVLADLLNMVLKGES